MSETKLEQTQVGIDMTAPPAPCLLLLGDGLRAPQFRVSAGVQTGPFESVFRSL